MAPQEHNGDDAQTSFQPPPPLFSASRAMDESDVPFRLDSSSLGSRKGFTSRPVCDARESPRSRSSTRPKLPSFKGLGISSFEPYSVQDKPADGTDLDGSKRRTDEASYQSTATTSSSQTSPPKAGSTPLLTPPEELDSFKWTGGSPRPSPAPKRPIASVDTEISSSKPGIASLSEDGSHAEHMSFEPARAGGGDSNQESGNNNAARSSLHTSGASTWLARSVGAVVISIDPSHPSSHSIQIVSQTLPHPAKETARPNAMFTEVIGAIQTRFGSSPQPYITITHAVPPRFDLLYLPSSPPSTPNPFVGRDDYFTQSIFAHAAVVPSYHMTNNSLATPAPASPNPIVPPSSVQISVLERYIPPATPQEGKDLFSVSGQSVLIDRLAELSPNKGTMLFVYPTKTGASTFMSKYVSQVLDPLLRALVEVHQLSYGLAESLGNMAAVADMHEFPALKDKITSLCRRLSQRITSDTKRSNFNLVYASTGDVTVDRRTWTEWYLKQEHSRFKRTLETYWGRGQRLSQLDSASAGSVLREFIAGVSKMTDAEAEQMGPGIELGVFVIRRNLAAAAPS